MLNFRSFVTACLMIVAGSFCTSMANAQTASDFRLVPFPAQLTPGSGAFELSAETRIAVSNPGDEELSTLGDVATELVYARAGVAIVKSSRRARVSEQGAILLMLTSDEDDPAESYRLEVSDQRIVISASSHAGLFYGIQTLGQLAAAGTTIPAVLIVDQPRFGYRGMHLDVGRHFFSVDFIKKYIDLMAMYKFNTFHWHLTEDQGWRIEIKKYPRLTEVGAYRKETILEKNFDPYIGDKKPYGGYYTQDEVREVVAYAQNRYITIIPEIEMPGHSVAALAAYPELACTEGPFEVSTIWGVKPDIYCPKEETFAFLEDVLTEVMELFPGTYIHIGGDEAPKLRWEESEFAQQVIQREGLQDEHELQSYFIRRIEEFLLANGRRLIGWDEILEGGLAPQATVMSWRGTQGGIDAAQQGHDVIMTPTSHMYFDYYQAERQLEPLAIGGYLPLEKVYAFEPIPEVLNEEEAKHILGAQGNVWTEYMKTTAYVEYMVFPRLLALSEVVWSPAAIRDWDRFVGNLNAQLEILDAYRINYRVPHVTGLETDVLTLEDEATVTLSTLIPEAEIRYTTDGSDPGYGSELYTRPFRLPVNTTGVVVMARAILPNGRQSGARSARFYQTRLQPAVELAFGDLSPGLRYAYYEAQVRSVRQLPDHEPVGAGVMTGIGLEAAQRDADFGLEISGFIRVPESDIYTFHLLSDDGSELRIGSTVVVDHDGYHGATERQGTIALAAGYHPITVRYFQAGGAQALRLSVTIAGKQRQAVDERWLFHRK